MNKKLKNIFQVIFFACLANTSFLAQNKPIADSSLVQILTATQQTNFDYFKIIKIDTSIVQLQNYLPINSSGALGLPSNELQININVTNLGFHLYQLPYNKTLFTEKDIKYYKTNSPIASLTGVAGSKEEQVFNCLFSNTFKNKMNVTVEFNRNNNIGFYQRQIAFVNEAYVSSHFQTEQSRFSYFTYFSFNRVKHQESGGVKNDSLISKNIDKQTVPIYLSNAKREYRSADFFLNLNYKLNQSNDSLKEKLHFIEYDFKYTSAFSLYQDEGVLIDKYYLQSFYNKDKTYDSTYWNQLIQTLRYKFIFNNRTSLASFGIKQEQTQFYNYAQGTNANYISLFNFSQKISTNNILKFKGQYCFSGYNSGDYLINLQSKNDEDSLCLNKNKYSLEVSFENKQTDLIFTSWRSNHFIFTNPYKPTQTFKLHAAYTIPKYNTQLGLNYNFITNYTYFNNNARPRQYNEQLVNISPFIKSEVCLWKHLVLTAQYAYLFTNNYNLQGLPENNINASISYANQFFKNALQLQVGISLDYYTKFYGLAYMPATNIFYVQQSKMIGEYPFVNFFINARINPVRFFIKIDHINQGYSGTQYMLQPNYYTNDFAIKFGINWLFYD